MPSAAALTLMKPTVCIPCLCLQAPVRSMASELCSPTTDMLSWPLPRLARFACALAALHLGPPGVDPDPGVREWANNTVPQMFQVGGEGFWPPNNV
jgi:hypothetical protein